MLYGLLLSATRDTTFIMKAFRQLVHDLNTPIIWLFWGILCLVVLDVLSQLSGNTSKYGYLVGKVMIEAFFYSLFFAIWSDVFQSRRLKQHLQLVQKVKNIKQYAMQPIYIVKFYIVVNNIVILYYASYCVCICYCSFSCLLFVKVSSFVVSCSMQNSHVYINNSQKQNKSIDAIIKWEYSEKPKVSSNQWVILHE